jgi:hypothetical protein
MIALEERSDECTAERVSIWCADLRVALNLRGRSGKVKMKSLELHQLDMVCKLEPLNSTPVWEIKKSANATKGASSLHTMCGQRSAYV